MTMMRLSRTTSHTTSSLCDIFASGCIIVEIVVLGSKDQEPIPCATVSQREALYVAEPLRVVLPQILQEHSSDRGLLGGRIAMPTCGEDGIVESIDDVFVVAAVVRIRLPDEPVGHLFDKRCHIDDESTPVGAVCRLQVECDVANGTCFALLN